MVLSLIKDIKRKMSLYFNLLQANVLNNDFIINGNTFQRLLYIAININ